ncbi:MAG: hypothetical protein ACOYYS_17500 [Chloroflexota bacterium]
MVLNDFFTLLNQTAWLAYFVAAMLSMTLAVAEIVTVFEQDAQRALRTWGAFLLICLNVAASTLILALLQELGAEVNVWLGAAVGIGLPTLIRTRFTVLKPLPGSSSEGVDIQLDQLYERLQRFCRRGIDLKLAEQRVRLVDEAIEYIPTAELEQRLRLLLEGGLLTSIASETEASQYVDKIMNAGYDEERVKTLLAFGVLNYGGHSMLEALLRDAKKAQTKK